MGEILNTLRKARRILKKPGSWTQRAYARNKRGYGVDAISDSACKYCVYGALYRAAGISSQTCSGVVNAAGDMLDANIPKNAQLIGQDSAVVYNDAPRRRRAHILRWFNRAIAAAKREGA